MRTQEVGASLHAFDITITDLQTRQTVPTQFLALTYNAATRQLSATFPGFPGGILPDGNYQVNIRSSAVVGSCE